MDFATIIGLLDKYLLGFAMTIFLTVTALVFGLIIAILSSIVKYNNRHKWFIHFTDIWVFYFRGTPCLIQIYLIYYGLAQFSFIRDSFLWIALSEPVFCALLALTLNTAAYSTEFIFGAMKATPKGEIEAAKAFAFGSYARVRHIIFPSVIRRIIPLYANEAVFLMQATALASSITVIELTQVARIINSRFFIPFEAFLTAAFFYMLTSYAIYGTLKYVEKRLHIA